MLKKLTVFALVMAVPAAWTTPLSVLQPDHPPLAAELSTRLAARASHLMTQDSGTDLRLPFPNLQELVAIKKVADTLIMLGQEVIPSIIGEMPMDLQSSTLTYEIPNDAVNNKNT